MEEKITVDNKWGALFRTPAEKLSANPKFPWATGAIEIHGVKIKLAAWMKEAKSGNKYISLCASYPDGSEMRLAPVPNDGAAGNANEADGPTQDDFDF